MASEREKSPTAIGLGKMILPERKALDEILTEVGKKSNPQDVANLILGPCVEIMGLMKKARR